MLLKDGVARKSSMQLSMMGCLLMTLVAVAHASGQSIAPASGKDLCSALTPQDFTKAGVPVSRLREANLDNAKSAYCIYDSAAGKVEFDIYFPAGDTVPDAQDAEKAAQHAIGDKFDLVPVAGADEASSNAATPNIDESSIVVRKGTTVFNISIPHGGQEQPLEVLSQIVLSRLKQ